MTALSSKRFVLEYKGHAIEVESVEVGFSHVVKLFIDGEKVDEQKAVSERATLTAGDITVLVQWAWTGGVVKCVLVEGDEEILLEPPPESHAERVAKFQGKYPTLYAFRHVFFAVLQVLIPLLGIGVIVRSFLPDINIREFFQEFFEPLRQWLRSVVDSQVFKIAKWLFPIFIALLITLGELEKQQKKREKPEKTEKL